MSDVFFCEDVLKCRPLSDNPRWRRRPRWPPPLCSPPRMQQPDCWGTSVRIWTTARGRQSTASRQNSRRFTVRFSRVIPAAWGIHKCCPSYGKTVDFLPCLPPCLSCLQYFSSVCHYVYPSVHLSACLYSCLPFRPPIWLSVHLYECFTPVRLSLQLSVCPSTYISACLYPVCPSVHLYANLYTCLPLRPPVWLSVHLCTWLSLSACLISACLCRRLAGWSR